MLARKRLVFGVLVGLATSRLGLALETPPLDDVPVLVDVTESMSFVYNTNNRNTRRADVASQVDDDWAMWNNRLNLQGSWKAWRVGLRLDSAWFPVSRSPTDIALRLLELERRGREDEPYTPDDADFFVQKFFQAGDELSDRFISWTYPAKYSVAYTTPDWEATVGDFYAQFGQGLVLSVRKQDELASDTTIRGARLSGTLRSDELRLQWTGLGGTLNPLRVDSASGRSLTVAPDTLDAFASATEAGMPRAIDNDFQSGSVPNYLPDRVLGAQLEAKGSFGGVSLHGTRLLRSCLPSESGCESLSADLVRDAGIIDTGGVGLNLPRLSDSTAAYVEYAHQSLSSFQNRETAARSGDGVYARVNWTQHPFALTVEGKHYRALYPLRANIDVARAREFVPVQYSAPPTTEPVWNDTQFEEFNTCVTGGRLKLDTELAERRSVFGWLGFYDTWGESASAGVCETTRTNRNRVWDVAQGAEMANEDRSSYGGVTVGARFDSTARALEQPGGQSTQVFYREVYLRHDIVVGLDGTKSLQFQAWHRRRRQTLGGPEEPWLQGQTTTALQWDEHLNFAFGFEYTENPAFPDLYFNGQVRYVFDGGNVALFAGQRQGGLRCVGGICRIFPPFEGVRADATLNF